MRRAFLGVAIVCLLSSSLMKGAELSPVFRIGHPSPQSFSSWAYGYGALTLDQAHVAAYVASEGGRSVRPGQVCEVRLESDRGSTPIDGTVIDVLPNADPRTGQAIATVSVPRQDFPARTYASVRIRTSMRSAMAVPADAVLIEDGKPYVYRSDGKGGFDKVPVVIGEQTESFTEIKGGVGSTDDVLIEGALEWEANASGAADEGD